MTDRELLELAAKAVGFNTTHQWNADRLLLNPPVIALCIPEVSTAWNPLDNDGDALRLAVKLKMTVQALTHKAVVYFAATGNPNWQEVTITTDRDEYASTRLAIVQAAAAIVSQPTNSAAKEKAQ